jgi:hypothetical protein
LGFPHQKKSGHDKKRASLVCFLGSDFGDVFGRGIREKEMKEKKWLTDSSLRKRVRSRDDRARALWEQDFVGGGGYDRGDQDLSQ